MKSAGTARRDGADVLVDVSGFDGWTFRVHEHGGLTVTPAPGERLTQPRWRQVPVGAVLGAAEALTAADRLAAVVAELPALTPTTRAPGPERDQLVVRAYRAALAVGLPPRVVVAAAFGVPEQTAGQWFTSLRARDVLGSVHQERNSA